MYIVHEVDLNSRGVVSSPQLHVHIQLYIHSIKSMCLQETGDLYEPAHVLAEDFVCDCPRGQLVPFL